MKKSLTTMTMKKRATHFHLILPQSRDTFMCSYWWFSRVLLETVILYVLRSLTTCLLSQKELLIFWCLWSDQWHWCLTKMILSIFHLKADICTTLSPCCTLWPLRWSFLEMCLLSWRSFLRGFFPSLQSALVL